MKNEKPIFKSKLLFKIVLIIGMLLVVPHHVEAQMLKKLADRAQQKIEREAEKRAQRRIDKGIDNSFDEVEDSIDGKSTKKTSKNTSESDQNSTNQTNKSNQQNQDSEESQVTKPNVVWSKFDFVPGDTVIFDDGPSTDEENGEFPSRWDLFQGGAEIMEVDGEPAITFITGVGNMHNKGIVPYLKNSKEDYLPEVFTVEFDAYFNPNVYNERYYVTLHDRKNQGKSNISSLTVFVNLLSMGNSEGALVGKERTNRDKVGGWRHISIAYTKGKFKAYLEDQRLINIPHLEGNPTGITLTAGSEGMYLKNISIAKGGVKYYDRVLSEGKIIVNGIKFDTNKATLKPESMGPINTIYELMQKQPDLNFSVEGHTDSDGDDANNQTLSEARGKSVMNKLIEMGISKNRLKSTGFGESKPLDNNSTPEGKANNRRVEFVKFTASESTSIKGELMKLTGSSVSSSSNSAYDKLDKASAEAKLYQLFEKEHYTTIPLLNNSGTINGPGTVIVYATSDGNIGKMEILDIEKNTNYKLTIKYVTYNNDGSIRAQSNHFELLESYNCDLDKENAKDMIHSEKDFQFSKENSSEAIITPGELSSLRILR